MDEEFYTGGVTSSEDLREDLEDLFKLAAEVRSEIHVIDRINRRLFLWCVAMAIFLSACLVIGVFYLYNSPLNSSEAIAIFFGVCGILLSFTYYPYFVRSFMPKREIETATLNEILTTIHGLIYSSEEYLRPVEKQTYLMRLKRFSFYTGRSRD